MNSGHKSSQAQLFRLMVYRRALHPELFNLHARRVHRHGVYEAETWIAPAAHVVRFQADGRSMVEVVIEDGDHLPENGLIHALPCLGEKDYEYEKAPETGDIGYMATIQTESLTDNLFASTYAELKDFAKEVDAIAHEWTDPDGAVNFSMLDIQKFKREFHVQSYHLTGGSLSVLRTQSIFEFTQS